MIRRFDVWVFLFLMLLFCGLPASAQVKTVNEIVAVVNGEAVTRYELQSQMRNSLGSGPVPPGLQKRGETDKKRAVLRSMINEMLLRQEADRVGITVTDEVVRERVERIRQDNGLSREELKKELSKRGKDLEEFKELIRRKIKVSRLLSSMVRQKVVLTKEELRDYFQRHKQKFLPPRKVSLSLILVRDREKLRTLRANISQGQTRFSRAARRYSLGPNAEKGGDMGMVKYEDLNRKIRDVVENLDPGEMSSVFPLRGGYALVRLDKEMPGSGKEAFSRVRDKVRKEAYARKVRERYQEYVDKLRSKAVVDIRL